MPKRVKPETGKKQQDRYYEKHSHNNGNSMQRWTRLDCMIIMHPDYPDKMLTQMVSRTLKAIQVKRVRQLKQEKLK